MRFFGVGVVVFGVFLFASAVVGPFFVLCFCLRFCAPAFRFVLAVFALVSAFPSPSPPLLLPPPPLGFLFIMYCVGLNYFCGPDSAGTLRIGWDGRSSIDVIGIDVFCACVALWTSCGECLGHRCYPSPLRLHWPGKARARAQSDPPRGEMFVG